MEALTSLIHEDATQSMPPFDLWLSGRDDILHLVVRPGHRLPGIAGDPDRRRTARPRSASTSRAPGGGYEPWALRWSSSSDGRIAEFTFFLDTETLFPLFGLPPAARSCLVEHVGQAHERDELAQLRDAFRSWTRQPIRLRRELKLREGVNGHRVGGDARARRM